MIRYADVTEVETHKFATDASDLGLAPSSFPPTLDTDMGNGQPFQLGYADADISYGIEQ